jgi:hypothetical protein
LEKYQEGLGSFLVKLYLRSVTAPKLDVGMTDLWYGDQALKIVFPNLFKIDRFEVVPKAYQLELSSALY